MVGMKTYVFNALTSALLDEIATIRHEPSQPGLWEELARRELSERDRVALGFLTDRLLYYRAQRVNEATIWARAIYPLLVLAERGAIRAWSMVSLTATFAEVELRGEADGALAASIDEEVGMPYLVVIEAKRGIAGTDPMPQLLGAMLCSARLNEVGGHPAPEIFGCYTIADVWTFVHGRLDWSLPQPTMTVTVSREYAEKIEAETILAILGSIVSKVQP
jgi:hypothetical protein